MITTGTGLKKYEVAKIQANTEMREVFENFILKAKPLYINHYLWVKNDYRPEVEVRLLYSSKYIYVKFKVFEHEITARFTKTNAPVYKDSCVEFFLNPVLEQTGKYFNFEINPLGTMLAEFGYKRKRHKLTVTDISKIYINASLNEPLVGVLDSGLWEIELGVPLTLLEKYYDCKINLDKARANFYKCGDETKHIHFGAWSAINSDKPDFHLLQYFGNIIFKN